MTTICGVCQWSHAFAKGAAEGVALVFGKNILRLRRNGNGTKRNEVLRNAAECSEVERRSKLFFPFAEQ